MDSNVIYISSFTNMVLQARKIAVTCNPLLHQGRVCHRAASKLADANSASELACRHMMTSQFRSGREKTRKREISRDFSRFFDPAFFRSFIDPFCPFRCCVRTRTHEKGLFCVFPKAIGSVAGFGLAKAEPDSAKKPPLHKLFTNTFDPSSNCPDLNSRN